MAKQNISFLERYVEKIVVGFTGIILLGTAIFYTPYINTPNKINVDGEFCAPEEFYSRIKAQADTLRTRVKSADVDLKETLSEIKNVAFELSPYKASNLPLRIDQAFAAPNPPVPDIGDILRKKAGKIKLADILPPVKILVTTGYAQGTFPEIQKPGLTLTPARRADNLQPLPEDHHWATLMAVVDRKKQRDIFSQAKYESHMLEMIVTGIELERQEVLPDGGFGESKIVRPYSERIDTPPPSVVPVTLQNDIFTIREETKDQINLYRDTLATRPDQISILRSPFQEYLEKDKLMWSRDIPRKIEDFDIDLEDEENEYGIIFPPEKEDDSDTSRKSDLARIKQSREDMIKAKEALEKGDFLEMEKYLLEVKQNSSATDKLTEEADTLLETYEKKIQVARQIEERRLAELDKLKNQRLGDDADLLWANDVKVVPGKTYRYRARLLAFNQYFSMMNKLEDPQRDAGKVILSGQWSEWSDPVTIKPDRYLFCIGTKDNGKTVRLEVARFVDGSWRTGTRELNTGQPIVFSYRGYDYHYDGIIVDIKTNLPYRMRKEQRDKIVYLDKNTDAISLINSRGETEDRIVLDDIALKKELDAEKKELRELRKQQGESPSSYNRVRTITESPRGPIRRHPSRLGPGGPRPRGGEEEDSY